jgi:hypothetical protein
MLRVRYKGILTAASLVACADLQAYGQVYAITTCDPSIAPYTILETAGPGWTIGSFPSYQIGVSEYGYLVEATGHVSADMARIDRPQKGDHFYRRSRFYIGPYSFSIPLPAVVVDVIGVGGALALGMTAIMMVPASRRGRKSEAET